MEYLKSLKKEKTLTLFTGENVDIYNLEVITDPSVIKEWADHFRNNYCLDEKIDKYREATGLSRKEYLLQYKFPDKSNGFGPATRSGDFAELLISDYLEFLAGYYVPKDRYNLKFNRSTSSQGTDVIGLKLIDDQKSPNDEMIVFEVKSKAQKTTGTNRLQDAINDSYKDYIRKGETLNAINQRAIDNDDTEKSKLVSRFMNEIDYPYNMKYGAAAVYDKAAYSEVECKNSVTDSTKAITINNLIVIKREDLMNLINEIYEKAADC